MYYATIESDRKVVWNEIKPTADEIMSVERESEAPISGENTESKFNSKSNSIIEIGEIKNKTDMDLPFASMKQGDYMLAMTGSVFELIMEEYNHSEQVIILNNCSVFARMSPEQKALLV